MKIYNKHIFVDAHVFDKTYQGTRTYLKGLYSAFLTNHPEYKVTFAGDQEILKSEFGEFKNAYFINLPKSNAIKRLLFDIPKLLKIVKYDFAHFQYITPLTSNTKYIVTTHDILFKDFPKQFSFVYKVIKNYFFKKSAQKADILLTVSNYSKERLEKHYRITKDISITVNGINNDYFKNQNSEKARDHIENKFGVKEYILFVSRIEKRKNHHTLLAAYLQLELYKKNIPLVFIGNKADKYPELYNKISSLNNEIKSQIHFLKNISDQDLIQFYVASKLCVYPSIAEGFGIPPLESGVLLRPTICSNSTAMSDFTFFRPYHINTSDVNTLKSSINEMLTNPPTEERLNKIRNEILNSYTWDNSALCLYNELQKY